MTSVLPSIVLSTGFLHRRHYNKVVRREMAEYGLRPLDFLHDGDPFPANPVTSGMSELMRKADGYLAVIDTQYIMTRVPSQSKQLKSEFEEAVEAGLTTALLVVRRRASAPKHVDKGLDLAAEHFKLFHARNSKDLRSLMVLAVDHDNYLSGMRDLLGFLRSRSERADRVDPPHEPSVDTADATQTIPTVPDQSPAPIRVEERDGRISRISDRDSQLGAAERDFNDWREPVFDHIQEMLSGDFRPGTNHGRARDRLVALATFLAASITEMKERQFRIGYEIERLGGLVSAYRSGGDDMPTLSADVLEDLDRLRIALVMGISKLERWAEFHRAASLDLSRDGDADPVLVGNGLADMAVEMERQPTYFDPELPQTFRFLVEATRDPGGATKTVVYGGVKSAENVMGFLGRKALGIGVNAAGAVERHISKAVATALVVGLGDAALRVSGALPTEWAWLQPLLTLVRGGGG
jgi:hypothetical protein